MAANPPPACSCRYIDKNYDPSKGYYFDKKGFDPLPTISYRMECLYICTDKAKASSVVSYVHSESRYGHKVGGIDHAKHFVCDLAVKKFIPYYDFPEHISTYEVEMRGDFPSNLMNHRTNFKAWNNEHCGN